MRLLIREFRVKQGLSQIELAKKIGISNGYLSEIESYKKSPRVSTLEDIAKVLGVKVKDLMDE
ncbi:hypothetical protein AN1V17_11950 [Vallitalea sediminicola]